MKRLKTGIIIIVFLASIVSLSGCVEEAKVYNIGIIFATGGLGDLSFNDAAYRGYLMANETYYEDMTIDYVEPVDPVEFDGFQNDFAELEKYDLIICIGFLQQWALNDTARAFPDQKFMIVDSKEAYLDELDNVKCITFKEHEGSFLVGAMAAMSTNTSKLGFLGGMDIPLINKFLAGYQQGAKYINSSVNVTGLYMGVPPPACWDDATIAKSIAEGLFAEDIDIVYAAAGGAGFGTIQAANVTKDVMAIGVDSDQDWTAKGKVLCSMLKLVETAVFNSITQIVEDTWNSTAVELGLKKDGVGISPMTYTTKFKNGNFVLNGVTKTRWEWIQDIKQKIIDGTIVVSEIPS